MKMTVTFDNGKTVDLPTKSKTVDLINSKYPEMGMMIGMEELNELGIALSKGVRNGNAEKLDNIAEEMMDVCAIIQWAIKRFDITPDMLHKWSDYKCKRTDDRTEDDSLVFRTDEAKAKYEQAHIDPNNQLLITRKKDGKYSVDGNTEDLAEYFHVLKTGLEKLQVKAPSEKEKKEKKSSTPKVNKKAAKDLDKVLDKASKKAKDVDKEKDSKKKDDKKKKDEKKGKKDKK